MSKTPTGRQPAVFHLPDEAKAPDPAARPPGSFPDPINIVEETSDPFTAANITEDLEFADAPVPPKSFGWASLAAGAASVLVSLAIGLWIDRLIGDLFLWAGWLGWVALGATIIFVAAVIAIAIREIFGMHRLTAARHLKDAIEDARLDPRPAPARKVIARLVDHLSDRPETARGRERLARIHDEIIDGPQLVSLAERELMVALDGKARALIIGSAKRVSVVTAVSPRALVDLAFVVFEASRLVRNIAELYGARPGRLGFLRLFRDVLSHLAVTGSIAVGDSLVQQFVGHGLAARLSARLGEGVINGLMTARIGIAAMDLCRPMRFSALPRPGIGDMLSDISSMKQE